MADPDFWELEKRFWVGGEEHYGPNLHCDAAMVFTAPVGILSGEAIVEAMNREPRWSSVTMDERLLTRPAENLVTLAYRATAARGDAESCRFYCSSTYYRERKTWRLIQHQQTQIG
jgi:hypothetical protein